MNGLPRRAGLVPALLCAGAGAALFQFLGNATHGYIGTDSLFYWWGFQWVNPESETQHAWLVLALAVFAFWRNLASAARAEARPEPGLSGAVLAGALALHALGYVAQQPRLSILALLLYAWGCLLLGGGRRLGDASAFPLGFMVFAIPVNALDGVAFWMRLWVVKSGACVSHALGIAVIRSGTQLLDPQGRYQYDVAAACSGIRSLMALAALSLFIGYLWLRPAWLRAAVLLLSVPLMYAGNVLRIVSIIVAARFGGQGLGDTVHEIMGYAVFAVVLGGVILAAEVAVRRNPAWAARAPGGDPGAAPVSGAPAGPAPRATAALVVALCAGEAAFLHHRASVPAPERAGVALAGDGSNPVELPTALGTQWIGRRIEPTAVERAILPPDTGYSRKLYIDLDNPATQVLLSIVLSGRDRTSIHRPELCLVGQGWTIDSAGEHRFSYPGPRGAGFPATLLHVHRESPVDRGQRPVPELVAYWFVGADRVVASQPERMLYDAWNRISKGRADRWAYVLVQTRASDGEQAALARIQEVLGATLPVFQQASARARGP